MELIKALILQRFSQSGAAADAGVCTAETQAGDPQTPGETADSPLQTPAGPAAQNSVPGDRDKAFEALIKGEYKDAFARRTQRILDSRFKQTKALEAKAEAFRPVVAALAERYGIDPAQEDLPARLLQAVTQGSQPPAATAQEAQAAQTPSERQEAIHRTYAGWVAEGEQLRTLYPSFDLEAEVSRPQTAEPFLRLLMNGVDMQTAYEVVHKDELLSGAIRYAVENTQRRTLDSIRANGARPAEAAAGPNSTAARLGKPDPSQWNDADMDDVLRRVRAGEKIPL